jgi:hypothetical protein
MMPPSPRFFTATMAELYARQGYLRKAAQIYRHLLQQEPGREDLDRRLQVIQEQIGSQTHPSRKELGLMLREWAQLLAEQKELKRNR